MPLLMLNASRDHPFQDPRSIVTIVISIAIGIAVSITIVTTIEIDLGIIVGIVYKQRKVHY